MGGGCRERSLPLGVLRGRQPMSPLTTKAERVVIVGYIRQALLSPAAVMADIIIAHYLRSFAIWAEPVVWVL